MKFKAVVLLSLTLAACGGTEQPQAALQIVISPAANPTSDAVLTCAPASEDISVSIDSYYPGTFALADYDIFIHLGEPEMEAVFTAQIATEEIVVIANPALGLDQLTRSETADLFSGRGSAATLWAGPESDEARQLFTEEILLGSPVHNGTLLAASPEQMLAEVVADPNAVGILAAAWADETVAAIPVGIQTPVLAVSATQPSGAAQNLIACLQGETGQAVLTERYEAVSQ